MCNSWHQAVCQVHPDGTNYCTNRWYRGLCTRCTPWYQLLQSCCTPLVVGAPRYVGACTTAAPAQGWLTPGLLRTIFAVLKPWAPKIWDGRGFVLPTSGSCPHTSLWSMGTTKCNFKSSSELESLVVVTPAESRSPKGHMEETRRAQARRP